MENYDLVILGAGPGGYSAGETAALYGLKTAIIEKKYFGGVCLNVGCIPTKALLKSAKILNYLVHANNFGIEIEGKFKLHWNKMQLRKEQVVSKLTKGIELLLKSKKVTIIKGIGEVISPTEVKVGDKILKTKYILIATGSTPVMLPLKGFKEAFVAGTLLTSTEALKIKEIPKSINIIGGGVIGVEFAALFAELGSKVTIIQGMPTILELLDTDVSREITKVLKDKGVNIILNAMVKEMKGKTVLYEVFGETKQISADKTLLSVGRRPNTSATDKLNIKKTERKQYVINEYMQTSIPSIYAVGDCSSPLMLAHVAYRQGDIAIAHMRGLTRGAFHLERMPWCLYLHPEGAGVGLTENEIKKKGIDYLKATFSVKHLGKALADGDDTYGFLKMMIDKKHGEILGCHVVAANASDIITEVVTAMELETTIYDLASTTHPHPSMSEIVYEVAKKLAYELDKAKGVIT